jgi:cholesterol oxidase
MAERSGPPLGFTFSETMGGYIAPGELDYAEAARVGRRLGEKLRFRVTILMDDLAAFLADETHAARMTGTVEAKRFGGTVPLEDGLFNLFVEDGNGHKLMRYTMSFGDTAGRRYRLDGFKDVHNDPGLDMWKDTTTLFTRVYRLEDGGEQMVATGVLRIRPIDLIPQVRSMRALNAQGAAERAAALARFGRFFFDKLWDEYRSSLVPRLPRRRRAKAATGGE